MSSAATEPALVPELLVTDTSRSIAFWCGLCGFEINYQRVEEGFAYISRRTAHMMLEQRGISRNWITAQLDRPFGRGINFQITVPDLAPILSSLREADYPLFMPLETKWYRIGDTEEAGSPTVPRRRPRRIPHPVPNPATAWGGKGGRRERLADAPGEDRREAARARLAHLGGIQTT